MTTWFARTWILAKANFAAAELVTVRTAELQSILVMMTRSVAEKGFNSETCSYDYLNHHFTVSASACSAQICDFVHSALCAFTLIVCTYERRLLYINDMKTIYLIQWYALYIFELRIFSDCHPSPIFPLLKYWKTIRIGKDLAIFIISFVLTIILNHWRFIKSFPFS